MNLEARYGYEETEIACVADRAYGC